VTTPAYSDLGVGYVKQIQATIVNAVQAVFNPEYRNPNFQGVHCSVEYPDEPQDYPSIWVQYDDAMLQIAGIAHTEFNNLNQIVSRWRFQGFAEFTVVAMSSLERDALYDEVVSQIAFASQTIVPNTFRTYIEADPLIATTWSWDTIEARGKAAAPGTPWDTMEVMYERSFAIQVLGEFLTSPQSTSLVNLKEIQVTGVEDLNGVADGRSLLVAVDQNWAADEAAGTLPFNFPGPGQAFGGGI
jgi:hypothetical protein